jgi:hypothetical protein
VNASRQPGKLRVVRRILPIACFLFAGAALSPLHAAPQSTGPLSAPQAHALVQRALANELIASQDVDHPMRYLLRKSTPRLTSTREIYETAQGDVARLISINDSPIGPVAEQKEEARLQELARDPARQHRRKQAEDADTARALRVLRLLPTAFIYSYIGPGQGPLGPVEKFSFRPDPTFSPPNLETEVLSAMAGELWVDPTQQRVTHLEGHVQGDVQFGWGILGRLNRGGWISIDQSQVAPGLWRTVRLQLDMTGRVLFRARVFKVLQEQSRFAPLPAALDYRKAIELMLAKEKALR